MSLRRRKSKSQTRLSQLGQRKAVRSAMIIAHQRGMISLSECLALISARGLGKLIRHEPDIFTYISPEPSVVSVSISQVLELQDETPEEDKVGDFLSAIERILTWIRDNEELIKKVVDIIKSLIV